MRLNHSKSTVRWFKVSNCKQFSEFLDLDDDTALQVFTKQKYFGVILDDCLLWNYHVSHVCKKMSYYLYVISKLA